MNEIIHGIWISDIQSVREESTQRFNTVITVCQERVGDNIGCRYEYFDMADGPENTYGGDASFDTFEDAADELHDAVQRDDTTLIHCHKGQSRSVSVAAAVIGHIEQIHFTDALEIVATHRPQANPDELLQTHGQAYIMNNHVNTTTSNPTTES